MFYIVFTIYIFLEIIQYIIFLDVILSWLTLVWVNFRPKFVADFLDPIYKSIRWFFPTTLWPIDFTPIVVIMLAWFFKWVLLILFPEHAQNILHLLS